jgi:hypothetical protein
VRNGVGLHRSRPSAIRSSKSEPITLDIGLWQGTALPEEHTDPYVELVISNDEGVLAEVDLDHGGVASLVDIAPPV